MRRNMSITVTIGWHSPISSSKEKSHWKFNLNVSDPLSTVSSASTKLKRNDQIDSLLVNSPKDNEILHTCSFIISLC